MASSFDRALAPFFMALAVASSGTALAQGDGDTQAGTKTQSATPKTGKTVRAMFESADKNKDGQLTLAEAKGHLPIPQELHEPRHRPAGLDRAMPSMLTREQVRAEAIAFSRTNRWDEGSE